jgi:hypothetical protein
MKNLMFSMFLSVLILATSWNTQVQAEEEVNVSGFRLGTHLMGTEITPESLKGKVVVVERWGAS